MWSICRYSRAILAALIVFALLRSSNAAPPIQAPSSQAAPVSQFVMPLPPLPSSQGIAGIPSPYASSGPASLSAPSVPQYQPPPPPGGLPPIGGIASPYNSSGPATFSNIAPPQVLGSDQASSEQGNLSGIDAVPSPYASSVFPSVTPLFSSPTDTSTAPGAAYNAAGAMTGSPFAATPGGGALSSGLGGAAGVTPTAFAMIGDAAPLFSRSAINQAAPLPGRPGPPQLPRRRTTTNLAPSVRGFKMAENQSPVPQDRVFFGFNNYNNVNAQVDKHFNALIQGINIYRYVWGFEKTFNNGMCSFGMRLPLDNAFAGSTGSVPNFGGNSTALGNLTLFWKRVLLIDEETGSLLSGGLAVTPPTATSRFAGAPFFSPNRIATLQPFLAFYLNLDKAYVIGFSSIDIPMNSSQPLMYYNDLSVGYFLFRDYESQRLITAIAPTVEVHVNTPLNHSNPYSATDLNGTAEIVDITSGLNVGIRERSVLTMGAVVPVTGPRPFSIEATVLLNYYFGRSRRPAPVNIGG